MQIADGTDNVNITVGSIREELLGMRDEKYRDFSAKLVPGVDISSVIGVRMPLLHKMARRLNACDFRKEFLADVPHAYHEENLLHALMIGRTEDFCDCCTELEAFLPHVDNWAVCDSLRPKCFGKNTDLLMPLIERWLCSEHAYTVRFAIEMLMVHFLDGRFDKEHLRMVSSAAGEEYYVNMMIAWYFATALAMQYDSAVIYLERKLLPSWIHGRTIQKAIESFRVSDEHKEYLRSLRLRG